MGEWRAGSYLTVRQLVRCHGGSVAGSRRRSATGIAEDGDRQEGANAEGSEDDESSEGRVARCPGRDRTAHCVRR
jgi:hypothetical protein